MPKLLRSCLLSVSCSGLNSDYGRDVGWRREFYNLWDSFINEGILLNCSVRLGDTFSPAEVFETTAVITALYPCRFFRCLHPGHHHHLRGKVSRPRRLFLLPNTTIDNNLRSQSNDRRLGGQSGLGTVGCGPRARAHTDKWSLNIHTVTCSIFVRWAPVIVPCDYLPSPCKTCKKKWESVKRFHHSQDRDANIYLIYRKSVRKL